MQTMKRPLTLISLRPQSLGDSLCVCALIARNVWETQEYYRVMASEDAGVKKALEILGNDKEYKRILK